MARSRLGIWWLPAMGMVAGLAVVGAGHVRAGGYLLAGTCVAAAALRLLLPRARAGALEVRSRGNDVVVLLGFGVFMFVVVHAVVLNPRR